MEILVKPSSLEAASGMGFEDNGGRCAHRWIVTFDRPECSRETDSNGHSEPYLWPVLMKVDDNTMATEADVSSFNLADQNARIVIKEDFAK